MEYDRPQQRRLVLSGRLPQASEWLVAEKDPLNCAPAAHQVDDDNHQGQDQ